MEKIYSTGQRLSSKQTDALLSKLIYSIEGINGCYINEDSGDLHIELSPASDIEQIDQTVEKLIEQQKGIRPFAIQVSHEHDHFGIDQQTIDNNELHDLFNGLRKKDSAVLLFEAVERKLYQYAKKMEASIRAYPSMISREVMETCSYIKSFPQNLYAVSEFPHQNAVLEQVKDDDDYPKYLRASEYVLSPAVCFHCYAELKNTTVKGPLLLTSVGTCFRHEAYWRLGEHRLNEFKMREIVFVGAPEYVEYTRNQVMNDIWEMFKRLGLSGKIETAHDPFYFPKDAIKQQYQLMSNMKYELVVNLKQKGSSFSIASFNNVKDTLCKEFHIVDEQNELLHSGCVAFGIDRWVFAILASYGADPCQWPAFLLKELEMETVNQATV